MDNKINTKLSSVGKSIIYRPRCPSTNTLAKQLLLEKKLKQGTVIITDHQYQGKGQNQNIWQSAPYKNLTFSWVIYPNFLAAKESFCLNIIVSVAIYRILSIYISHHLTIKWPNDIYYQNKKITGILINNTIKQAKIATSIVGIGLNINQKKFNLANITSLTKICQKTFNTSQILSKLLEILEQTYNELKSGGIEHLRKIYLQHFYWINETHIFQDQYSYFQGIIQGIDPIGRLIIKKKAGEIKSYDRQAVIFVQ